MKSIKSSSLFLFYCLPFTFFFLSSLQVHCSFLSLLASLPSHPLNPLLLFLLLLLLRPPAGIHAPARHAGTAPPYLSSYGWRGSVRAWPTHALLVLIMKAKR